MGSVPWQPVTMALRELDCPRGCGGTLTVMDDYVPLGDQNKWFIEKVIGCTNGCSGWAPNEVPVKDA